MRLIDADELMDRLKSRFFAHDLKCDFDRCARSVIISCMEAVQRSPTITQPLNEPITLDELQEMDGEPVFIKNPEYWDCWALVQVRDKIMFTLNNGAMFQAELEFKCGGKAYRRKTEEKRC